MLNKVEVYTMQGAKLDLPLRDSSLGYLVKSIDGLDPVKATIASSGFALLDGVQEQAAKREERNIVLTVGLLQNYIKSTMQLRMDLYPWFMPKTQIRMRFIFDGFQSMDIIGRVETMEAPLFSKDPEAAISILCPDPMFYALTSLTFNGTSKPDLTHDTLSYPGSVETGFLFTMTATRSMPGFVINHQSTVGEDGTITYGPALLTGDIIRINTVRGQKSATLTRDGITKSALYSIDPTSTWIQLDPGRNNIRVYDGLSPNVPYTLEYLPKFGGL